MNIKQFATSSAAFAAVTLVALALTSVSLVAARADDLPTGDPVNGNGHAPEDAASVATRATADRVRLARLKGYEGDPCTECGQLTLVRSGACAKCDTCGATSGCS